MAESKRAALSLNLCHTGLASPLARWLSGCLPSGAGSAEGVTADSALPNLGSQ